MRVPGQTDRTMIVGATGSGKTICGLWHLQNQDFTRYPWIVYDYKGDNWIRQINATSHFYASEPVPTQPGIHVVKPLPDEEELVSLQMFDIWRKENTGIYVDEGFMIGKNNAGFRACLTQGRSKNIPMIVLSQRPVWVDRFAFSEAGYFQVFRLQHEDDVKSVNKFIPEPIKERLPKYHSYYYDVNDDAFAVCRPVPDGHAIIDTINLKLSTIRKVL